MSFFFFKSFIVYAICFFVLFIYLFIYYTCEQLLYVQDDNHVDKEYEKANERRVATRRWRCILCWSRKIVSHDGLGYLTHGKTIGGWNQH